MRTGSTLQRLLFGVVFCLMGICPGRVTAQKTSNTCVSSLNADLVTKYEIIEGAVYIQTNSAGVVPEGTNNIGFQSDYKARHPTWMARHP